MLKVLLWVASSARTKSSNFSAHQISSWRYIRRILDSSSKQRKKAEANRLLQLSDTDAVMSREELTTPRPAR